jgi:hypothetical protein
MRRNLNTLMLSSGFRVQASPSTIQQEATSNKTISPIIPASINRMRGMIPAESLRIFIINLLTRLGFQLQKDWSD